jgi:hypothetical protein
LDFGKPGLSNSDCNSSLSFAMLDQLWVKQDSSGFHFVVQLEFEKLLYTTYGSPQTADIIIDVNNATINITLQWYNKTGKILLKLLHKVCVATRLPESVWFGFNPRVFDDSFWTVNKIGQEISPLNVVMNGSRHLHGIDDGVCYNAMQNPKGNGYLRIQSLDAGLVNPGKVLKKN